MRWVFLVLVLINVGLAAYAWLEDVRPNPDAKILALQMNADQIKLIAEPPRSVKKKISIEKTACLEWGSFGELELRRVRDAIAPMKLGERLTERQVDITANWWVFMPAQKSKARMERKADELVQLGVTDFVAITEEGRWQYAISLGAFREEEGARSYLSELRTKGVRSGDIGQREQKVKQTFLVIRAPAPAESTQLIELGSKFPGSKMQATECEG